MLLRWKSVWKISVTLKITLSILWGKAWHIEVNIFTLLIKQLLNYFTSFSHFLMPFLIFSNLLFLSVIETRFLSIFNSLSVADMLWVYISCSNMVPIFSSVLVFVKMIKCNSEGNIFYPELMYTSLITVGNRCTPPCWENRKAGFISTLVFR